MQRKRPITALEYAPLQRRHTVKLTCDSELDVPEGLLRKLCQRNNLTTEAKLDEFLDKFGFRYTDPEDDSNSDDDEEKEEEPATKAAKPGPEAKESKETADVDFLDDDMSTVATLRCIAQEDARGRYVCIVSLRKLFGLIEALGIDLKKDDVDLTFDALAKTL